MKPLFRIALLVGCALLPAARQAHAEGVSVTDAWVRATVPGQKVTSLYLSIASDKAATLVGIAVPASVAGEAEIHETVRERDFARMQQVARVPIAAGKPTVFTPGGRHIMLIDLRRPLKIGETVPLTLRFAQAGKTREVAATAVVRPIDAASDHSAMHGATGVPAERAGGAK